MPYFLGIPLPSTLTSSILKFREMWGIDSMEPHITVKAPCGLTPDEKWLEKARHICQASHAFEVSVGGVSSFGSTVLYLRVLSPNLISLHKRLVQELGISVADQKACFENDQYSPHITLIHQQARVSEPATPFASLQSSALQQFGETTTFLATSVMVYNKNEGNRYSSFMELTLGQSRH